MIFILLVIIIFPIIFSECRDAFLLSSNNCVKTSPYILYVFKFVIENLSLNFVSRSQWKFGITIELSLIKSNHYILKLSK